jgi:cell division septation protein DedD
MAISFNENLTINDGLLVQKICRDYGLSTEQASKEVQEFIDKTTIALEQREIITLPGIGRLYKNYAQKVQFLPDNTNFNTESYGLPPLQFSPIIRSREVKEQFAVASGGQDAAAVPQPAGGASSAVSEQIASQNSAFEPTLESPDDWQPSQPSTFTKMLPWLVGLTATALAVAIWYTQQSKNPTITGSKTSNQVTELPVGGTVLPSVAPPIVEKKATPAPVEEKADSRKNDDDADVVSEYEKKKQDALAKQKEAEKTAKNAAAVKVEKTSPDGRRAVIVVGTWKDKKTADEMLGLLKKGGYNTYFRKENGWQVGIETIYKDFSELKTHLTNLEKLTKSETIWIKKK